MAFAIDRVEAAKRLSVSTRTIDRHIQAGRIRTKRIGKKMFLDDGDVELVRQMDPARREEDYIVIMDDEVPESTLIQEYSHELAPSGNNQIIAEFSRFYTETQALIAKKDETIQDLSYRLGKIESEITHTIPVTEYKKATYLLESAKSKSDEDTRTLTDKVTTLEKEIIKRNSMILGLTILFILVLAFSVVFFLFTRGFTIN
jgi:excisionase family DNA binding protein